MNSTAPLLSVCAALGCWITPPAHASLALWSAHGMERIGRHAVPRSVERVTLAAARNEWEAVQLVVFAPAEEQAQAAFSITPFTSTDGVMLPPAELYQEQYVTVRTASPHSPLGVGEYADALVPAVDAKAPSANLIGPYNQPWWLEQFIPTEAVPGIYLSTVTCHGTDGDRTLTLELTVWPITLPARSTLRSTFGCHWGRVAEIHHLPSFSSSVTLREKVAVYQALLAAHRLTPEPMYPEIDVAADGTLTSFPLAELRTFFQDLHATSFPLPICATWPFADPLKKDRKAALRYLRTVMKIMQQQGWASDCFVDCPVDEPASAAAYAQVRAWGQFCQEAAAGCGTRVPLLCTVAPEPHPDLGSLLGAVDIWVPCVSDLLKDSLLAQPSALSQQHAAGAPVWAYTAMVDYRPEFTHGQDCHPIDHHPPTWCLDFAPMNYRILAWQCAAQNLQGLLYWDTIHWGAERDPWTDPGTFTEPGAVYNGDGCLLYPSAHGPVASLRLKWLRDGMEDHCLIQLAKSKGLASLAETEVSQIARGIVDWDADPTALLAARQRLGAALSATQTMQTTLR